MNRRALLELCAALGLAGATEPLWAALQAADPPAWPGDVPAGLLDTLVDMILPASDTPGARAVGAAGFLARYRQRVASRAEAKRLDDGLAALQREGFLTGDPQARHALLARLDDGSAGAEGRAFFRLLKSLTLLAYYTSEVGASQELAYLPMPDGFRGRVPFSAVGRAWS